LCAKILKFVQHNSVFDNINIYNVQEG